MSKTVIITRREGIGQKMKAYQVKGKKDGRKLISELEKELGEAFIRGVIS